MRLPPRYLDLAATLLGMYSIALCYKYSAVWAKAPNRTMSLSKLFSRSEKGKSTSHSYRHSLSGLGSLFTTSKAAPKPSSEEKDERADGPSSTREPGPSERQDGSDGPNGTGADSDARDAKL